MCLVQLTCREIIGENFFQIELEGSCAMQVDGEPWMQGPATILIEPAGQSLMLRAKIKRTE